MKKITFKTEFTSKEDAFAKIPDVLKEDKSVFVMTDGNKTYNVRWEGTLTEGIAVPLKGKDEKLISEDMKHIQHLMGYKSEDTLGVVKGTKRIDENETFKSLMGKVTTDTKKKD
jgi:hypothetical protein